MPSRNLNVRVSVRKRNEDKDADWGVEKESFSHVRYQRLQSLTPIQADRIGRLSRADYEADWEAYARGQPKIEDGWRLVTFLGGDEVETRFRVEKSVRRGRVQHLFLKEVGPIQS
jgi:hypothetical protein